MFKNIVYGLCFVMLFAMVGCSQPASSTNDELNNTNTSKGSTENASSSNNTTTNNTANTTTSNNNAEQYPIEVDVYSYNGTETTQTIEKAVEKVVIVGSTVAELMVKFGQQDKVVGFAYSDQSNSKYAEEINKLPLISEMWPSKESVIALQPDIIYSIASALKEELLGDIPLWNKRGIPVISSTNFTVGRNIAIYFDEIKTFGKVFNIEEETNQFLQEQQQRIDEITSATAQLTERPKVLVVGGARGTYYYYSPKWAMISEMVEGAGAEYMELSDQDYIELSTETIIAANPDKIIITEFQQPDQEVTKSNLLNDPKLQNMKAIQNQEVMVAEYTSAINGGLELVDLYEQVAAFIHPDLFAEEASNDNK